MCEMRNLSLVVLLLGLVAVVAAKDLEQYTPNQANWDTFATKPFTGGSNTAHDPDGVSWISAQAWKESEWDGKTTYSPTTMSHEDFVAAICPSVDRVRGIREVFYKKTPFADNNNPTKAEIDEWHRIAINHARALVGYTSEDRQAKKDHCMFARALWGDERKFTTQWDAEYPGTTGSAAGPCQGSGNAHCGASFIPDLNDQKSYLPDGHPGCGTPGGAEGVFSGPKSNIPWALKWSRGLCNTLHAEGFWGGHTGPWFHREKFGLSFWDPDASNNNNNAILRAKWTGSLMRNPYCNPNSDDNDAECVSVLPSSRVRRLRAVEKNLSGEKIQVKWSPSESKLEDWYKVRFRDNTNKGEWSKWTKINFDEKRKFTAKNLKAATEYKIQVKTGGVSAYKAKTNDIKVSTKAV